MNGHSHYITEMAEIWMLESGLNAIAIPYDISSEEELKEILD